MFVMISPLQAHLSETLTSLKFATKVSPLPLVPQALRLADSTGTQHAHRNGKEAGEDKGYMNGTHSCNGICSKSLYWYRYIKERAAVQGTRIMSALMGN